MLNFILGCLLGVGFSTLLNHLFNKKPRRETLDLRGPDLTFDDPTRVAPPPIHFLNEMANKPGEWHDMKK